LLALPTARCFLACAALDRAGGGWAGAAGVGPAGPMGRRAGSHRAGSVPGDRTQRNNLRVRVVGLGLGGRRVEPASAAANHRPKVSTNIAYEHVASHQWDIVGRPTKCQDWLGDGNKYSRLRSENI